MAPLDNGRPSISDNDVDIDEDGGSNDGKGIAEAVEETVR